MKMKTAVRILQLLPVSQADAITISDLAKKWVPGGASDSDVRNIQRYMNDLTADGQDEPALVEVIEGSPRRFYLKLSRVANWFMTEAVALHVLLSAQAIGKSLVSLDKLGTKELQAIAEKVAGASADTRRLREKIRVVPDGFGRLPAHIDSEVLRLTIDAIVKKRQLSFTYVSTASTQSNQIVSPQGLVCKDGTMYLVATKELNDKPRHFPLHRMSTVDSTHKESQSRLDFDLDRYIAESNQFSHTLYSENEPIELELSVADAALYHFKERKLVESQTIQKDETRHGYNVVRATIHNTVLLVPFLLSMGGWVEVIGPKSVRDEMALRVREMASNYL